MPPDVSRSPVRRRRRGFAQRANDVTVTFPDTQLEAAVGFPNLVNAGQCHSYLETHQSRMDYARYRQLGLPIMTAYYLVNS